MKETSSPPVSFFILPALFFIVIGFGGLYVLMDATQPTVGPRWLFFFLLLPALTGCALPIMAFLNRRFPSTPPASVGMVFRQALWFGVFGATVAWLQIGRVLTVPMALLLLIGLGLIEFLLRLSERSQWKP